MNPLILRAQLLAWYDANARVLNFLAGRLANNPGPTPGRLVNLSTRGYVGLGAANLVGGFVVTDRILEMFKARPATPPPLPKPPEDIIHPEVSILIGPEPVGVAARTAAVRDLPHDLSPLNLSLLMDFMNGPKPAEMQDRTWHGLVDSLINVLRRQNTAPEGLTDATTSAGLSANRTAGRAFDPSPVDFPHRVFAHVPPAQPAAAGADLDAPDAPTPATPPPAPSGVCAGA